MKYLNKFDTRSDYEASASTLEIPNVAYITATTEVIYNATVKTYIVFADPLVEEKCVQLYSSDGIGCTEADLAAVSALSASDWSGTSITSFNELGYFSGLTSIPEHLFYHCSDLTSVVIPDSVTSIGYEAFNFCSALTSVTISDSVTSIANQAFINCRALTSITIPDSVTSIGGGAFDNCYALTSVNIGSGVTSIGNSTFVNCYSLTSAVIPNSVTSMGTGVFEGCSGLTSVTLSNQVGQIGSYSFFNCSSLSAITIPASVTQIGGGAFMGCPSLSGITFISTTPPATIASDAFYNLASTGNITVPVGSEANYYDLARSIGANWTVNNLTPPALNYVLFEATATTAASDVTELTLDGVTISGNTYGTGGVMFNNTNGYRFMKGCTFDIIATGGNITKIEFTQSGTYSITNLSPEDSTVGTYTCADGVGTWVASDAVSTVSFNSNAAATRCTSIKVYLE